MRRWTIAAATLALATPAAGQQGADTRGTISVELTAPHPAAPEVDRAFAEAVQHALLRADFLTLPATTPTRYIARVTVRQEARGLATTDGREAPAAGGAGNWGAQIDVTLPSHKRAEHGLVVTRLNVVIVRRNSDETIWRGSALTAQAEGTPDGAPAAVAGKLADALIGRYPEVLKGPVSVP